MVRYPKQVYTRRAIPVSASNPVSAVSTLHPAGDMRGRLRAVVPLWTSPAVYYSWLAQRGSRWFTPTSTFLWSRKPCASNWARFIFRSLCFAHFAIVRLYLVRTHTGGSGEQCVFRHVVSTALKLFEVVDGRFSTQERAEPSTNRRRNLVQPIPKLLVGRLLVRILRNTVAARFAVTTADPVHCCENGQQVRKHRCRLSRDESSSRRRYQMKRCLTRLAERRTARCS